MAQHAGYLVDLSTVKLDERDGVVTSTIQAMTVGTYKHPVFGDIKITPERIQRFADNVNNNIRETELDIDYDHKAKRDDAAGWVKMAEARPNGLFVKVEWTDEAVQKIRSRAYKYFSPEFTDEWEHPKTGKKFEDVLFGGGITNRPFLKDIVPINLSEAFASDAQVATNQGGQMDPKKLRELLGLPEDATEEQVTTALTEKLTAAPENKDQGGDKGGAAGAAQLSEEVIRRLSEENPAVKALAEQVALQKTQLAEMAVATRLAEVSTQVIQLDESAKAKGRAFPPAPLDAFKALLVKVPKQFGDELAAALTTLAETGFVSLGEQGTGHQTEDGDALKKFNDEVKKFLDANEGMSFSEATVEVSRRDPALFVAYQEAAYNPKIGG
jgi:phage I-like protein